MRSSFDFNLSEWLPMARTTYSRLVRSILSSPVTFHNFRIMPLCLVKTAERLHPVSSNFVLMPHQSVNPTDFGSHGWHLSITLRLITVNSQYSEHGKKPIFGCSKHKIMPLVIVFYWNLIRTNLGYSKHIFNVQTCYIWSLL